MCRYRGVFMNVCDVYVAVWIVNKQKRKMNNNSKQ